jgi:dolichol-phosphate mannosyltransferase
MSGLRAALPSFGVVVPMFNERAGAARCVREIGRVLDRLPNQTRVIVVDDGSSDGTAGRLRAVRGERGTLEVVAHATNQGYGAALRTGARRVSELGLEYVLFMDSDLTNSPRDIPRFVARMAEGVDVIKATRYSGGGSARGVPRYRVAISRAGNAVARALFRLPVHDCTNGFRAVRTPLLAAMRLHERNFAIIMEELYWCRFLARTYAEVPVTLTSRGAGQRPTSFVYRPSIFWRYLKYPLRARLGLRPRELA